MEISEWKGAARGESGDHFCYYIKISDP